MGPKLVVVGVAIALVTNVGSSARGQDWQQDDGIFNPSGIPSLQFSQPRLADLDDDDDFDLILGSLDEAPLYFRNAGGVASPEFEPGDDIFAPIGLLDAEMGVGVDLDGDDDLDLVTGGYTGLHLWDNVGSATVPVFAHVDGFFAGLAVGSSPVPTFADLDGDGDQDLVVGLSGDGRLKFYPNSGSPVAAVFTEATAEVWFDVGLYAYPYLCDLDNDLDFDLMVGRDGPGFHFYRNVGDATTWQWQADHAVFADLAGSTFWNSPCLVDLTDDGLVDLVYGTSAGPLQYFVNTGSAGTPVWTANSSLFGGVLDVGAASSPVFFDFDDDGDLDLASGSQLGDIRYFANVGTAAAPAWLADHAYFSSIDHSIYAAVTLGDVDDDGLADAIVGDLSGQLFFHRNTGSGFVYDSTVFQGVDVGSWSVPRLVDMDGDLDLDLVVGNEAGGLVYYLNQGQVDDPDWVIVAGFFGGIDVGSNCVPTLGDFDHDEDLDLVTGSLFNEVRYYENVEGSWIRDTTILAGITVGQNAAPALADLDADGDLDLTVGHYGGTFNYFENTSTPTGAPDPQELPTRRFLLSAAPNPFNPRTTISYDLPRAAQVSLAIYDLTGYRLTVLADRTFAAGTHTVTWNGRDSRGRAMPSGTYIVRLETDSGVEARKLMLVR